MSLIELWDVLIKPKSAPPLCSDCRHSRISPLIGSLYCKSHYADPAGGEELNVLCTTSRYLYCKSRGRYFEPKASEPERMPGEEK